MKLAIGIDTGGTCTDAVLYDFDTGRVLGQQKALTTYDDLTRGILAALDGLDPALCRQAAAAGLSTTLATNACVEGKFRPTRLLLMGVDRTGIARYGADYGFTDPDAICYLPCRTTITGQVLEAPDWDVLRANARAWFAGVEGCAVCEIHGTRNGGVLEHEAARIVRDETGLPVVCASDLFGGLSSLERAASAVLNAGLLPVTQDFLAAVTAAFRARGIGAQVFIVRSDSSLMGMSFAAEHAVETLLSGPAASALGGSALTGRREAVIVDIGGTTTDVALIEHGAPLLRYAFRSPAALIGIGGPVHLFLPAAAQALGAACVIPDCAATANAVGAVTGQMTAAGTAEVRPHGLSPEADAPGDYEVLCAGQPPRFFAEEQAGLDWAEAQLRTMAEARLRAQGATGPLSFTADAQPLIAGKAKPAVRLTVTASTCLIQTTTKEPESCTN